MTQARPAIIFVPGIRPKPPAVEQQEQLRRCLDRALSMACATAEERSAIVRNFHVVGWSHQFYGEHAEIAPDLRGIDRLLGGLDDAKRDSREAESINRRVNAFFYSLADRFPLLTHLFGTRRMETRVEEIHRYFDDQGGKATAARFMVAQSLQAAWRKGQPVLMIGHSFGSVIAYDTLWELSRLEADPGIVDLFVSMGSPLTMRYIRQRLLGCKYAGAERYPENIERWLNLAAIGEVTALDRRLADYFGEMLRYGLVKSIQDNLSLVNQFRADDKLNVHKCYGYLASPMVGKVVLDWYRDACPDSVAGETDTA